jgi:hypothetical protein
MKSFLAATLFWLFFSGSPIPPDPPRFSGVYDCFQCIVSNGDDEPVYQNCSIEITLLRKGPTEMVMLRNLRTRKVRVLEIEEARGRKEEKNGYSMGYNITDQGRNLKAF